MRRGGLEDAQRYEAVDVLDIHTGTFGKSFGRLRAHADMVSSRET